MAKGNLDKTTAIKSILSDLKKGIEKKTILQKIASKCEKDKATIYRWYSEAEKQFLEFRAKVEPIEIQKTAELEAEANMPTKEQAINLLWEIANNAERDSDKVSAAKTVGEFLGWKAPAKTENTHTVTSPVAIKFTKK